MPRQRVWKCISTVNKHVSVYLNVCAVEQLVCIVYDAKARTRYVLLGRGIQHWLPPYEQVHTAHCKPGKKCAPMTWRLALPSRPHGRFKDPVSWQVDVMDRTGRLLPELDTAEQTHTQRPTQCDEPQTSKCTQHPLITFMMSHPTPNPTPIPIMESNHHHSLPIHSQPTDSYSWHKRPWSCVCSGSLQRQIISMHT